MRNWALAVSAILLLAANCFAQPAVLKAAAVPEPGVLVALGSGLVGLAAVVRRRLNS